MSNAMRNGTIALVIALAVSLSQLSGASAVAKIATKGSISIAFTNSSETSLKVTLPQIKTAGAKKKIQWLRSNKPIANATKATYTLKAADRGTFVTAQLTLTKSGFKNKVIKALRKYIQTGVLTGKYELLWQEEFTGSEGANFDSTFWTPQEGDGTAPEFDNPGWGNEERQYYLSDLAKLNGGGQLVISATKTNAANYDCYYGDCHWLSSKIVTLDKVGFLHGRIEVRAKGAKGEGTWPAVWTLGSNIEEVRWPNCGEIDIMELKGSWPGGLWGTAHGPFSGGAGRGGNWSVTNPSTTEDFHIYAIEWFTDHIDWYVDGKLYYTYEKTDGDWVFDSEQYLILNLAMGGIWGGLIDFDLTDSQFTIDYARYYSIDGLGELISH
jgi:beta-glucanase (GH16 family)